MVDNRLYRPGSWINNRIVMPAEIRKVQYPVAGGQMVFHIGQILKTKKSEFEISHFKRIIEPTRHVIQIFIKPPNSSLTALWKEVVNGYEIIDFNVDFLCKV